MSRPPTIVIVDDSPEVRSLVRTQIRLSERFEVVGEGANGLDAVALASRHRPDLMLLDVSMPLADGLAALPKVLENSPQTRVVVYSGFDQSALASRAEGLGASAFVEKSAPFEVLVAQLVALSEADPDSPDTAREGRLAPGLDPTPEEHFDLEEHLEPLREVFEDAAIGMATMTLAGRLVRANRSLGQLLSTPVEQLVGMTLADLTDEPASIHEALLSLDAGESIVEVEHRVRGGADRTFRSTLSPVIDARGRPLYIFLQLQDVSRQAAAEVELRGMEARFRLLVEAVEDYAIFMLDPSGYITSWNAGAQRSKGYSAEEIIGQHFRLFYPPEKQAIKHPEYELEEALRRGRYEEEGWRVRKDGSMFWASVTITAVRHPDGKLIGFAKVTRDITERLEMLRRQEYAAQQLAEANERLEEANEQLEEANRQLAEVADRQAQFFALTAHELRAPVSVLSGATTTLARHFDDLTAEDRTDIADAVARSSTQLRRLLDDLLTAARLQARRLDLETTEVELSDHLESVVGAIRQSFREAAIRVETESGLCVRADPVRLTQMIDNLVMNALRHGRPPVEVSAKSAEGMVEIAVRDAGEGVSTDVQQRLFERFATGSSKGTGLGLFLVRELARAHGGDASYRPRDRAFVLSLLRA